MREQPFEKRLLFVVALLLTLVLSSGLILGWSSLWPQMVEAGQYSELNSYDMIRMNYHCNATKYRDTGAASFGECQMRCSTTYGCNAFNYRYSEPTEEGVVPSSCMLALDLGTCPAGCTTTSYGRCCELASPGSQWEFKTGYYFYYETGGEREVQRARIFFYAVLTTSIASCAFGVILDMAGPCMTSNPNPNPNPNPNWKAHA